MKRKAFIFGTFNPVTNTHINMGLTARDKLGPECQIIYVPTADSYIQSWKGYNEGDIMSQNLRSSLLYHAVLPHGFIVSNVEVIGLVDGRTYNTIKYFGFENSVLCLGMDNIIQMKKWYRWEELLPKCRLLIFRREGCVDEQSDEVMEVLRHSCSYEFADIPETMAGISSTEVRRCYKDKNMDKLRQLVPENVFEYLEENENVYF